MTVLLVVAAAALVVGAAAELHASITHHRTRQTPAKPLNQRFESDGAE